MKRLISGIKPSGALTLGNYLGAIKPFIEYQKEYQMFVFIADLHALTLPISSDEIRKNIRDLLDIYLAAGLGLNPLEGDQNNVCIFQQSKIKGHTELNWLLTCNTVLGELTKMPQYKNFCEKHKDKPTPAGMLMYPSLMSADILLYDADFVPVGQDQVSHVDLCRDMAEKFNRSYPNSFTKIPQALVTKVGAKIMSLSDPTKKMSKSESDKGTIYLLDDIEISKKKIMKAITDSENQVKFDPINKPGVSNLLTIYSCLSGKTIEELENKYQDIENYGVFKRDLCDVLEKELSSLQSRVNQIRESGVDLEILEYGNQQANKIAGDKIEEIYGIVGLR